MISKKFKIITGAILVSCAVALWLTFQGYEEVDYFTSLDKYKTYVRLENPELDIISARSLDSMIQNDPNLLIIDCRSDEEYRVSHIPGALHFQTAKKVKNQLSEHNGPAVIYCSVGNRSSKIAKTIGSENLQLLSGGIFEWANEGHQLEGGEKVHPYKDFWARLLNEDITFVD